MEQGDYVRLGAAETGGCLGTSASVGIIFRDDHSGCPYHVRNLESGETYWYSASRLVWAGVPDAAAAAPQATDSVRATSAPIVVGSRVRVRMSLPGDPGRGWGSVRRGDVGVVTEISGSNLTVDFPRQSGWSGVLDEMECVEQAPAARSGSGTFFSRLFRGSTAQTAEAQVPAPSTQYRSSAASPRRGGRRSRYVPRASSAAAEPSAAEPSAAESSAAESSTAESSAGHELSDDAAAAPASTIAESASTVFGISRSQFIEYNALFTLKLDEELLTTINRIAEAHGDPRGLMPDALSEKVVADKVARKDRSLLLCALTKEQITARIMVLQLVNALADTVIPMANMASKQGESLCTDLLRANRHLLFWHLKSGVWTKALTRSVRSGSGHIGELKLDRFLAAHLADLRKTDFKLQYTLFAQAFNATKNMSPSVWRLSAGEKAWKVSYVGLNSTDAGGPYRESLEEMCRELMSPVLPLFCPCVNRQDSIAHIATATAMNKHCFVPRRAANSPLLLQAFEWVGRIMGLAVRTKTLLALHLAPLIYKKLVGEPVSVDDVRAIDEPSATIVNNITEMAERSPEDFDESFDATTFTARGSDGVVYELVRGGKSMVLTLANHREFTEALMQFRLREFDLQCAAIRRGLATVVPVRLLSLFSWHELETQVCGRGVDLQVLQILKQSCTSYEGCSAFDAPVQLLWQMLETEFDDEERGLFFSFVWGRSRLPVCAADYGDARFKVALQRSVDALPKAGTCYFTLLWPTYSSLAVAARRTRLAIRNCGVIDTDGSGATAVDPRRLVSLDDTHANSLF